MNDHEWAALREHDGYLAALEVDKGDGVFRCRVVSARAVLTFEGKTRADLKAAFADTIANYLKGCKERGVEREKIEPRAPDKARRALEATYPNAKSWAQYGDVGAFGILEIDAFLSGLSNPQLSTTLFDAKHVARRALQVGYWEVLRVKREIDDLKTSSFDVVERTAEDAAAATDRFIKQLAGRSFKGKARELEIPILTLQAALQKGSPHGLHARAKRDAMTLLSARAVEQRLAKAARQKRIAASPGSGNPGNPDHTAFLHVLGEAWGHTGRWPGSSVDKRKNPFLRFVVADWEDVFGKDETPDFIGALRQFLKWSDARTPQRPCWL